MISSMESNDFTSVRAAVEFVALEDAYSHNENLTIKYKLNNYTPQEGDRIVIFKLGWTYVKDYILFEWAPLVAKNNEENTVTFNKHILPKNSTELFQVCYIGCENEIHGASSPFQFIDSALTQSTLNFSSLGSTTTKSVTALNDLDKDNEIKKLREDNLMFREALKAVIAQKNSDAPAKSYDKDIQELRQMVEGLKIAYGVQQKEINVLKSKLGDCAKDYQSLYLEKKNLEDKYEKLKESVELEVRNDAKKAEREGSFEIGELESIPPFPWRQCL